MNFNDIFNEKLKNKIDVNDSASPYYYKEEIYDIHKNIFQGKFSSDLKGSMEMVPNYPFGIEDKYSPLQRYNCRKEYPKTPQIRLLQPEMYRRYGDLILLYIFFNFSGSAYQKFAADALKSRGYIYIKDELIWIRLISHCITTKEGGAMAKCEVLYPYKKKTELRDVSSIYSDINFADTAI